MEEELIGNEAAAAYVGVSANTWRPYVARGQAPPPDRRQGSKGHYLPVWSRATLDAWMRDRPGPGAPGRPRTRKVAV